MWVVCSIQCAIIVTRINTYHLSDQYPHFPPWKHQEVFGVFWCIQGGYKMRNGVMCKSFERLVLIKVTIENSNQTGLLFQIFFMKVKNTLLEIFLTLRKGFQSWNKTTSSYSLIKIVLDISSNLFITTFLF